MDGNFLDVGNRAEVMDAGSNVLSAIFSARLTQSLSRHLQFPFHNQGSCPHYSVIVLDNQEIVDLFPLCRHPVEAL